MVMRSWSQSSSIVLPQAEIATGPTDWQERNNELKGKKLNLGKVYRSDIE
jgi:hypothetical protein